MRVKKVFIIFFAISVFGLIPLIEAERSESNASTITSTSTVATTTTTQTLRSSATTKQAMVMTTTTKEIITTAATVETTTSKVVQITHKNIGGGTVEISEREILAKLLYREAGGMGWEGQVHVCSAILNLRDHSGRSIWNMAHDVNTFAVAYVVDSAVPTEMNYKVIDYVLNGGRIAEIKYFREDYYHSFGTPVCQVENICFSK